MASKIIGAVFVVALCYGRPAHAQVTVPPPSKYLGVVVGVGAMKGHIGEAVPGTESVPTVVGSIGVSRSNRVAFEAEMGWAGRVSRGYHYKQDYLNTVEHFHAVGLLRASSPKFGIFDTVDLLAGAGLALRDFTSTFSGDTVKARPQFEWGLEMTKWQGSTGVVLGARVVVVPNIGGWPRTPTVLFLAAAGVRAGL